MNHGTSLRRRGIVGAMLLGAMACFAIVQPVGAGQKSEPRVIEIVAKRYTFEPNVVEVTEGEPVRLLVRSADGLHGFAIKKFRIDKEVLTGKDVKIDFVAREAGEFPIMCTVICGEGHASMTGMLKVLAKARR